MRQIKGQLHRISRDYRLFSIQVVDRLEFFYLEGRFVKQFRKYLYPGVFVQLTVEAEKFKYRRRLVSKVISFEQILGNRYHRKFSYFDQKHVKQEIIAKIAQYDYRLFLDLEMTLQHNKSEVEEIIQVGAILVDRDDQVIWQYNQYIKPTKITEISVWTLAFLGVKAETIMQGIPYQAFYQTFKTMYQTYQPAIIVWGDSDYYALEKSYRINQVEPLFPKEHFINMQLIHKQFYNLNYELGLFKTAEIYNIERGIQTHNAYEDAEVTRLVFNRFYYNAVNNIDYEFKKIFLEKS